MSEHFKQSIVIRTDPYKYFHLVLQNKITGKQEQEGDKEHREP